MNLLLECHYNSVQNYCRSNPHRCLLLLLFSHIATVLLHLLGLNKRHFGFQAMWLVMSTNLHISYAQARGLIL